MAEEKKGRGCFFYGCVTLIVLVIIAIIAIFFGVRYGLKYARDHYTASKGVAVAPVTLPPAEGARVMQRVEQFKTGLKAGTASGPLELTGDELDFWIRNTPGNQLKDHAHLTITNDRVHAELSMPLDMFGPMMAGRFFNGEADMGVGMKDGAVALDVRNAMVNGQPVPQQALAGINQNFVLHPQPNDPNAALMTNLDKVEIKDNKITFYPKTK